MARAKKTLSQVLAILYINSLDGLKYVFSPGYGWYCYSEKRGWESILEWYVKSEINKFCWEQIQETENLTKKLLNDVLELVETSLTVPLFNSDSLDPTLWIRFESGTIETESASGWIACNNALIDVEAVACALYKKEPIPEEAIKPLSAELFTLGRVPCDFKPGAECPRWLQFVSEVCPSNVDRLNLQRAFGLSLTYDRKFNVFFVLYGKAGTGKSTGLSVLEKLNSGCVCSVSLSDFGKPFAIYPLTENRLNLVADMPAVWESAVTAFDREAVLKSLTGGESVSIERKFKDAVKRRLCSLSVFGSNQVPRFADRSGAIRHRLRLIPFPVQFRNKAGQDTGLGEKLLQELPGILLWSLVGYGELIAENYSTFPESEEAESLKHEAELQANPVLAFCEECLETCPDSAVYSQDVYRAYQSFCIRAGIKIPLPREMAIPEISQAMGIGKPVLHGKKRLKAFLGIRFAMDTTEEFKADYPV